MHKIKQLSKYVISQIAAGEVIQNPYSVVKELVENAIDSGANDIIINIEDGGKQFISVKDNGCGMSSDDLERSILQHYTSKMKSLFNIDALGFRGEALFSISQWASLKIDTKEKDKNHGWSIFASMNHKSEPEIAAVNNGTCVTVTDLFKNFPVRLKFLKPGSYEKKKVEFFVSQIALYYNDISFKLISDGKVILYFQRNDRRGRVNSVMGISFAQNSKAVDYKSGDMSISGFSTTTGFNISTSLNQHIFLNGRYIKDQYISNIINKVYRDHIPRGRYASYIIFLTISPDLIDLHVHPTKTEVRFRDFNEVRNLISFAFLKLIKNFNQSLDHSEERLDGFFEKGDRVGVVNEENTFNEQSHRDDFKGGFISAGAHPSERSDFSRDYKPHHQNKLEESGDINDIMSWINENKARNEKIVKESEDSRFDLKKESSTSSNNFKELNEFKNFDDFKGDFNKVVSKEKSYLEHNKERHSLDLEDSEISEKTTEPTSQKAPWGKTKDYSSDKDINPKSTPYDVRVKSKEYVDIKDSSSKKSCKDPFERNLDDCESSSKPFSLSKESRSDKRLLFEDILNEDSKDSGELDLGSPIKQIFGTFIISETKGDFVFIDQHAAHERIVYESMKKSFRQNNFDVINLLIPIQINIPQELEESELKICSKLGFDLKKINVNTYNVIGYPSFIMKKNVQKTVLDILNEISEDYDSFASEVIEEKFADIACKASIKAGDKLTIHEMRFLIKQMESVPFSAQCNHGRPTYIKISNNKLRRLFERSPKADTK